MARAKKTAAAAAEVKEVKQVKEEVKAEVAAVEEAVEAPAKKPAAKKAPAKKAPAKAEKVEAKEEVKAAAKAEVFIEFGGVQVAVDEIVKNAKLTVGEDKELFCFKIQIAAGRTFVVRPAAIFFFSKWYGCFFYIIIMAWFTLLPLRFPARCRICPCCDWRRSALPRGIRPPKARRLSQENRTAPVP